MCDSTLPFRRGPPLNSMTLLRLNSTKEKCRTTPTSIVSEGHRIVLYLMMRNLRDSRHTISPHEHCHQSPKHLGINMPLQRRIPLPPHEHDAFRCLPMNTTTTQFLRSDPAMYRALAVRMHE